MELLDEQGKVLRTSPLGAYGWSDKVICGDGVHCLVSSMWEGTMIKVNIDSGEIDTV